MPARAPIAPPALQTGDCIGILALSSRLLQRGEIKAGVAMLEHNRFQVDVHPQTYLQDGSSAGTSNDKLAALADLWADDNIRAVLSARGGNHAADLLDRMDYRFLRKTPKIIMGYSDMTAFLNAVYAQAGLITFHTPVLNKIQNVTNPKPMFDLLRGKGFKMPMISARRLAAGTATGRVIGGNLSSFCTLVGTPYMPKPDGAILFLEDIGDETSRIDRAFTKLRLAGIFDRIAGVVLGQFTAMTDTGVTPYGLSMDDVLEKNFAHLDIPVIANAPFGHVADNYSFPIGGLMSVDTTAKRPRLSLAAPALS